MCVYILPIPGYSQDAAATHKEGSRYLCGARTVDRTETGRTRGLSMPIVVLLAAAFSTRRRQWPAPPKKMGIRRCGLLCVWERREMGKKRRLILSYDNVDNQKVYGVG